MSMVKPGITHGGRSSALGPDGAWGSGQVTSHHLGMEVAVGPQHSGARMQADASLISLDAYCLIL
jgi:hypothetical protein